MQLISALLESLKVDRPITAGIVGSHLVGVVSQRLGLAANPHTLASPGSVVVPKEDGSLLGRSARELARWLLDDTWLKAAIGMAAVNSLLEIDYESLVEVNAKEIIADQAAGKSLLVVGHFPFVESLRPKVRNLWVMEKERRAGDLSEEEGYEVLAEAEVVAITGSSILNHTLERIMASCMPGSFKIMLGPSTPLSPILLDFGLDVIGGVLVQDERKVLSMVERGVAFRQLEGVRTVVMTKDALRVSS